MPVYRTAGRTRSIVRYTFHSKLHRPRSGRSTWTNELPAEGLQHRDMATAMSVVPRLFCQPLSHRLSRLLAQHVYGSTVLCAHCFLIRGTATAQPVRWRAIYIAGANHLWQRTGIQTLGYPIHGIGPPHAGYR
jgi:hypothetical protein